MNQRRVQHLFFKVHNADACNTVLPAILANNESFTSSEMLLVG